MRKFKVKTIWGLSHAVPAKCLHSGAATSNKGGISSPTQRRNDIVHAIAVLVLTSALTMESWMLLNEAFHDSG
jgi:hypothetical protein